MKMLPALMIAAMLLAASLPSDAQARAEKRAKLADTPVTVSPITKEALGNTGLKFEFNLGTTFKGAEGHSTYTGTTTRGGLDSNSFDIGAGLRYDGITARQLESIPYFVNLNLQGNFADSTRNLWVRNHFGAGNDTGMRHGTQWTMRLGAGVEVAKMQEMSFYGVGGLQLSDECIQGYTDETSGGGVINRFREGGITAAPYFGFEARTPLYLGNILPRGSQLYGSATAAYVTGADFTRMSTLGNTYNFRLDNEFRPDLRVGVILPLNDIHTPF
jgi:hypothetical protein